MLDCNLSNSKIVIIGDLENALAINSVILITKKVVCSCVKKEQKLYVLSVKNSIKTFILQENIYITYGEGKINLTKN